MKQVALEGPIMCLQNAITYSEICAGDQICHTKKQSLEGPIDAMGVLNAPL